MTQRVLNKTQWLLVVLMLTALAWRVYHLESQSLWSDEGLSLYRSRLSLGENLSNIIVVPPNVPTRDTNPPLYFIALSGWRAVAGESEYALRFLSVAAGLLIVPLLYVVGRRLFSTSAGLLAATLGALSPFLVWYSQEARMYTWLAALSLASVYALLRAVEPSANRPVVRWAAWVLITAAAIYTHFTAFFLLPFEGLLILYALWRVRRRWALTAVVVLIGLSVPIGWYGLSRAQGGAEPSIRFRPLPGIAEEMSSTLAVGRTNETFQPWWAVAPTVVLLGAGVFGGLLTKRRGIAIALLYLLAPLLVFYAATFVQPLYSGPRHLMLIAPPFYLLAGFGAAHLGRRVRVIGVLVMVIALGLMGYWLHVQFTDPGYLKDDMRSAAQAIAARAAVSDVVIVHDAISSFVFDYYYDGAAPWQIIPVYPANDEAAALAQFKAAAQAAQRVWFVTRPAPLNGFPPDVLDDWARGHLLRLEHAAYPAIWLGSEYQLYTAHYPIMEAVPVNAEPAVGYWPSDQLSLIGWTATPDNGALRVEVYWRLAAPGQRNLVTTLRLIDGQGATASEIGGTMFDNWSVRDWPVGKVIRQEVRLAQPVAAGDFELWITVSERKSDAPLALGSGAIDYALGTVTIVP